MLLRNHDRPIINCPEKRMLFYVFSTPKSRRRARVTITAHASAKSGNCDLSQHRHSERDGSVLDALSLWLRHWTPYPSNAGARRSDHRTNRMCAHAYRHKRGALGLYGYQRLRRRNERRTIGTALVRSMPCSPWSGRFRTGAPGDSSKWLVHPRQACYLYPPISSNYAGYDVDARRSR